MSHGIATIPYLVYEQIKDRPGFTNEHLYSFAYSFAECVIEMWPSGVKNPDFCLRIHPEFVENGRFEVELKGWSRKRYVWNSNDTISEQVV